MEDLIVPAVLIVLVVVALIGAFNSVWFWGTALLVNLSIGLTLAIFRALQIRRPRLLTRVVVASWDKTDSSLHWRLDPLALGKQSLALPIAILTAVPGLIFVLNQRPLFVEAASKAGDDFHKFAMFLGGGVMAVVAVCGSAAVAYRLTEKFCAYSVRSAVKHFTAGAEEMRSLERTESDIRSLSDLVGVEWPPGLSEDVNAYIQREREFLVVNGKAFRRRVAAAVEQAKSDFALLTKASRRVDETVSAFKQTASIVNRTGAITLVREMELMHDAMTGEGLMSLLIQRKWKEFNEVHVAMAADLERIASQAKKYESTEKESGFDAGIKVETPIDKALRVLGANRTMSAEEIRKCYRQMARDYHPDKASQATTAIQALTEERFKEIQEAWEIIKSQMQVA